MDNKAIVEQFIKAFGALDEAAILDLIADDMEWHMLGDPVITGKENIVKAICADGNLDSVTQTFDHFIVDGNNVSVDGQAVCTMKNGEVMDMYYCDIYELENSRIKKMISYIVMKK